MTDDGDVITTQELMRGARNGVRRLVVSYGPELLTLDWSFGIRLNPLKYMNTLITFFVVFLCSSLKISEAFSSGEGIVVRKRFWILHTDIIRFRLFK